MTDFIVYHPHYYPVVFVADRSEHDQSLIYFSFSILLFAAAFAALILPQKCWLILWLSAHVLQIVA